MVSSIQVSSAIRVPRRVLSQKGDRMLNREDWLPLARKLDWEFSYTTEQEVFPPGYQRTSLASALQLAGLGRSLQDVLPRIRSEPAPKGDGGLRGARCRRPAGKRTESGDAVD